VLFIGVFFSDIFRRLHLPWVIALLLGGILIGPHVLGLFEVDRTMELIGEIGLVFLMFMAGLETKLSALKQNRKSIALTALFSAGIPFLVALGVGIFFGYSLTTSILLGIIFMSSSIAVIIPSLEKSNMLESRLGTMIMGTAIVVDVASLIALSVFLQIANTTTTLPLWIFYSLLVFALFLLRWVLPKIRWFFSHNVRDTRDLFQQELRSIFVILIGTVIAFELLGLHPIIAGFFAGLLLYLLSEETQKAQSSSLHLPQLQFP